MNKETVLLVGLVAAAIVAALVAGGNKPQPQPHCPDGQCPYEVRP